MNKQSIGKLNLFLRGLEQRLSENEDFFEKIISTYKSGTKNFIANLTWENKKIKINFNGKNEIVDVSLVAKKILEIAEQYESVTIEYIERGSRVFIEADNKNVKMKTKEVDTEEIKENFKSKSTYDTAKISNREYYIKVGYADKLLKEIGIMGSNGKIKNDMIRKYNQIDHFVELINDMLLELSEKYESLTILDCGCGKSYLTFVLNYYIKEVLKKPCYFVGLDLSKEVIEASKNMADNLDYKNMDFEATDIRNFMMNKSRFSDKKINMVISLHACDTATDHAIALGVRNMVDSMVVVPCCHRELLNQYTFEPFEHILKHGVFKARMADLLTDGMRTLMLEANGYKVSAIEYISPLETPKNLMIRASKIENSSKKTMDEYNKLKKLLNVNLTMEKEIW